MPVREVQRIFPDENDSNGGISAGAQRIAGQHSQPASVGRHRGIHRDLHREVGDVTLVVSPVRIRVQARDNFNNAVGESVHALLLGATCASEHATTGFDAVTSRVTRATSTVTDRGDVGHGFDGINIFRDRFEKLQRGRCIGRIVIHSFLQISG